MTIDLHQSIMSPFCRTVLVLARRIGVDLNLVDIKTGVNALKSDAYLELNPFHTIPTLVDDGFALFESRAIMTYLVSKYAPDSDLYPKDLQQRALVDAMLSFDAGSLTAQLTAIGKSIYMSGKELGEDANKRAEDLLKSLDLLLTKRKYSAGDHLTVADIAIVHSLAIAEALAFDLAQFDHVSAYYKTVQEDLGEAYREVNEEANKMTRESFKTMRAKLAGN